MISFDVDEDLFKMYLFYSSVLALKVLVMAVLTARQRFSTLTFANPEDAKMYKGSKVKFDDVNVERVRRAHLNDLENIPFFITVCFGYLLTKPSVFIASNLIRLFVASRIIHTIVYAVVVLPQPARGLSWGIAYGITIYMAVQKLNVAEPVSNYFPVIFNLLLWFTIVFLFSLLPISLSISQMVTGHESII